MQNSPLHLSAAKRVYHFKTKNEDKFLFFVKYNEPHAWVTNVSFCTPMVYRMSNFSLCAVHSTLLHILLRYDLERKTNYANLSFHCCNLHCSLIFKDKQRIAYTYFLLLPKIINFNFSLRCNLKDVYLNGILGNEVQCSCIKVKCS